jgi:hypothetical protein
MTKRLVSLEVIPMRALPLLFLALTVSTAAQAAIDFKCDSVKYEDQIGGWLRFGSESGRAGSIQLEYWNGYPPILLVDAKLDGGTQTNNEIRFVSESGRDAYETVATIDVPSGALRGDSFVAKAETRYKSRETDRVHATKFSLRCVRH